MQLFFLGTAAAEGYPGIFCNCANCQEARSLGGRDLRLRSALLVNDHLLLDFGPDLLASAQRFNKNLSKITTGLVTHVHEDHFHPHNFEMRKSDFSGGQLPTLHLYGPREVSAMLKQTFGGIAPLQMETHTVQAFQTWEKDGYTFTAYRARHALGRFDALFYAIDDGQRSFLYATDTGPFPTETWQALAGRSFDAVILEETMGDGVYEQHQSIATFLQHTARLREEGILKAGGKMIAHHFSHHNNPVHHKLAAILNPHGVEVAYDGLEVTL